MRPKADVIAWRDTVSKEAQQRREDWERLEAQRKRLEELKRLTAVRSMDTGGNGK